MEIPFCHLGNFHRRNQFFLIESQRKSWRTVRCLLLLCRWSGKTNQIFDNSYFQIIKQSWGIVVMLVASLMENHKCISIPINLKLTKKFQSVNVILNNNLVSVVFSENLEYECIHYSFFFWILCYSRHNIKLFKWNFFFQILIIFILICLFCTSC